MLLKIITVYRSSIDSCLNEFVDIFASLWSTICLNSNAKFIICGVVNINLLSNSDAKASFLDILPCYNLNLLSSDARRITDVSSTCNDFICSYL